MNDKLCARCKLNTVEDPDEELCQDCIDKRIYYSEFYYDTWDLQRMIGKSERTVRKKAHDGKTNHCGKTPSRMPQEAKKQIELMRLRQQLEAAVKSEDYELAVKLRDEIAQKQ